MVSPRPRVPVTSTTSSTRSGGNALVSTPIEIRRQPLQYHHEPQNGHDITEDLKARPLGWTGPVARALERFLELETKESWIRIRALFALGFLQHRDPSVENYLSDSCHHAYSNLKNNPSNAQIAEMHAALFAVGDCFGATEASEDEVRRMRESIRGVLTKLIRSGRTERDNLYPVSRACAYLLTFMILPRQGQTEDLAETLLKELRNHPDKITRQLSRWALKNRLGESGEVRQLVHARV